MSDVTSYEPTQNQGLANPHWRMGQTHAFGSSKARWAMWECYQWVATNPSPVVYLLDSKSGSNWGGPTSVANNDWFVARWLNVAGTPPQTAVFDVLFQATDVATLDRAPVGGRGLYVRVGYHASGEAWNPATNDWNVDCVHLPVAGQMARVDTLDQGGSGRLSVVGDDTWFAIAIDTTDASESYQGCWLGTYNPYVSTTIPLALTCGDMRRVGATGLGSNADLGEDRSGIVLADNSVKELRLPYVYGSILSYGNQPEVHELGTFARECPVLAGAKLGTGSYGLVGWLRGPMWTYGKTNQIVDGPFGRRFCMTDVNGGAYRCYGAASLPAHESDSPGTSLGLACEVGGP